MARRRTAAVLAFTLLVLSACGLFDRDHGKTVGRGGGSVASSDGSVKVSFTPGQLDKDTKVTFSTHVDGPPPVPNFLPLDRPFDIHLDQPSHGGSVTVGYQLPPDFAGRDTDVVMFIDDNGAWRLVPSTVDPQTHTVTGSWPHFSTGVVEVISPLLDAGSAGWDQVEAGASWVGRSARTVASGIASTAVGITGGTRDVASCESSSGYWTVRNSTGMTSCVEAKDGDGTWPAKINVRFPYPMMVKLPGGTVGPGWTKLIGSYELPDFAVAMIASRYGRLIIPAGKTVPVRFTAAAADDVKLAGAADPATMALRAVALLAAFATGGMSAAELAEGKAALAEAQAGVDAAFLASRKAADNTYTNAEYIRDTQADNGLLRMRQRELDKTGNALAVDKAFRYVEYVDCANAVRERHEDMRGKSLRDQVIGWAKLMIDECRPVLVKAVAAGLSTVTTLTGPNIDLAEAAVSSVKDIESLTLSTLGTIVGSISLGRYDPTKATVTLSRPKVDVVAAARDRIVKTLTSLGYPRGRPSTPGGTSIDKIGPDFIRYGQGGLLDTVPVRCDGPRLARATRSLLCYHNPTTFDPIEVAVRVTGDPPRAETIFLDGDHAQACDAAWARELLHFSADQGPCV